MDVVERVWEDERSNTLSSVFPALFPLPPLQFYQTLSTVSQSDPQNSERHQKPNQATPEGSVHLCPDKTIKTRSAVLGEMFLNLQTDLRLFSRETSFLFQAKLLFDNRYYINTWSNRWHYKPCKTSYIILQMMLKLSKAHCVQVPKLQ